MIRVFCRCMLIIWLICFSRRVLFMCRIVSLRWICVGILLLVGFLSLWG